MKRSRIVEELISIRTRLDSWDTSLNRKTVIKMAISDVNLLIDTVSEGDDPDARIAVLTAALKGLVEAYGGHGITVAQKEAWKRVGAALRAVKGANDA
jgi:hypothetical protein